MDRLAAACGSEVDNYNGKLHIDAPGRTWGRADVGVYDDGVRVTLKLGSVPFEKALRVVEVLVAE